MKAWFVWAGEPYSEWGDYVHGETPGKAKAMFWREWHGECEWIDLRPIRAPEFDDKPITGDIILLVSGYDDWFPICKCELCDK